MRAPRRPARPAASGLAVLRAALLAGALAGPLAGCAATEGDAYFAGIDDLPLMPGFDERPAERTSFETPAGRIEARGASGVADHAAVLRFYAETLPQLGWQRLAGDIYARGEERLRLDLAPAPDEPGGLLLRILITPG
jgi:hypothetical protein